MIRSITLQNFKSFGVAQVVPLAPITVLVGPNNSGKSNFVSVGRFLRNAVDKFYPDAINAEGGEEQLIHRPPVGDGKAFIAWETDDAQSGRLDLSAHANGRIPEMTPFLKASSVHLRIDALRSDAPLYANATLASDGAGLAAVVANWRGADLARARRLDDWVHRWLKEISHVLVRPALTPGNMRILVEQDDGQKFEPAQLSDGVMYALGLAVHLLSADVGQIIFIEEPETGLHPRRLSDVVDLLRTVASEGRQIVLSTHSPTLLDLFRDEPEAIVLFRRSPEGTIVRRLSDHPDLMKALDEYDARPGALLANGFFNEPL